MFAEIRPTFAVFSPIDGRRFRVVIICDVERSQVDFRMKIRLKLTMDVLRALGTSTIAASHILGCGG